ncbi:hypothetical protein BT67DRAFT_440696 [Trichocladium antarcticum]|uniref:Uncharacterized protein n=1 Tax=Trichocladium antarcticum TaxID=1450529 RepID=A0AAN6ZE69_9PEZI|nr:hypothetical protein BT67DRAFT_440696 [Trichocladium antarcticum]
MKTMLKTRSPRFRFQTVPASLPNTHNKHTDLRAAESSAPVREPQPSQLPNPATSLPHRQIASRAHTWDPKRCNVDHLLTH